MSAYMPPLVTDIPSVSLSLIQKVKLLYDLGHFPPGMTVAEMQGVIRAIQDDPAGGVPDKFRSMYTGAVESWQGFHERAVTGVLSQSDESYMTQPRCGLADVAEVSGDGMRQWGVKDITVSHNLSGMSGLTQAQINTAFANAVESWNRVCGIRMRLVAWDGGKTNIWARSIRIDGGGGTLAWSYLPGDDSPATTRLEQRYEPGESWTLEYLQGVAAHEIGHALGMEHSNKSADLMYPYARRNLWLPQAGDIRRVVDRYGKPQSPPPDEPPVQPPTGKVTVRSVVVTLSDGSQQTLSGTENSYNPL